MTREQVFLAVLTGVVACGPKFKRREPGQCGPLEVNYDKMIRITNDVTDAVMGLQAEVDRLNECLGSSHEVHNSCVKTVEAKEFKILELEEELLGSNQAVGATGSRPTWGEMQRLTADNERLHADYVRINELCLDVMRDKKKIAEERDILRKAVEDGAMEIDRLQKTLQGVKQITAMKPENVEALKAEMERRESIDDIKNDLSSMVANSTEGQRVVADGLEAPIDLDEWVLITDPEHVMRGCDWLGACDEDSYYIPAGEAVGAVGERADVYLSGPHPMFIRCRRKDLPADSVSTEHEESSVAGSAEDPEEYVLIETVGHKLRECDGYTSKFNMEIIKDCLQIPYGGNGGWVRTTPSFNNHPISEYSLSCLAYRCKRKDLPVAPPAAESQS